MSKTRVFLNIFLIFSIIFCASCTPAKKEDKNNLDSTPFIESDKTQEILEKKLKTFKKIGELNTGGYLNVPGDLQLGNLYSTYYTLKINEILEIEINQQTKHSLIKSIEAYFKDLSLIKSYLELNDFYYALEISKMLSKDNAPFLSYSKANDILFKLYDSDEGTFISTEEDSSQNEIMKASVTLTSAKIIDLYGMEIPDQTNNWLIDQIESNKISLEDNIDFILEATALLQTSINYVIPTSLNKEIIVYLKEMTIQNAFDLNLLIKASYTLQDFHYEPNLEVIKLVQESYVAKRGWNAFFDGTPEQLGTYFSLAFLKKFNDKNLDEFFDTALYYNEIFGVNSLFVSPISDEIDIYLSYLLLDLELLSKSESEQIADALKRQGVIQSDNSEESNRDTYYWNKLLEKTGMDSSYQKDYSQITESITNLDIQELNELYYLILGGELSENELKALYSEYQDHKKELNFPILLYLFSALGDSGLLSDSDVDYFLTTYKSDISEYKDEEYILYLLSRFVKYGESQLFDTYLKEQKKIFISDIEKQNIPLNIDKYYYLKMAWEKADF